MPPSPSQPYPDDLVERIVREVISRLLAMESRAATMRTDGNRFAAAAPVSVTHQVDDRVITAATLESVPAGTTELLIAARAIITPLARDEAKSMGIRLTRSGPPEPATTGKRT